MRDTMDLFWVESRNLVVISTNSCIQVVVGLAMHCRTAAAPFVCNCPSEAHRPIVPESRLSVKQLQLQKLNSNLVVTSPWNSTGLFGGAGAWNSCRCSR